MALVRKPHVNTVLILGTRFTEPLAAARAAGLTTLYLGSRRSVTPEHLALADMVIAYDNIDSAPSLVAAANAVHKIDLVVPVGDRYVRLAANMNSLLGARGNPATTLYAASDKNLMREALRDVDGLVRSRKVTCHADVLDCADSIGFPGILKPSDGSGSDKVSLIESVDDIERLADQFTGPAGLPREWIYEEYLSGPEFSVETFSADGNHYLLGITEKFKGRNFVEIGHVVHARIDLALRKRIELGTYAALTALGLVEGPAHTEVIDSPQGVRIVETHVRPGGDMIVELIHLTTGINIHELMYTWLAGREINVAANDGEVGGAAIWFLVPEPGKVTEVLGCDIAAAMPGVRQVVVDVTRGDEIMPLAGSRSRPGFVVATGAGPTEALRRAQAAAAAITVR